MLGVALPPSSASELDLKCFLILRDFCYEDMLLPEVEALIQKVFFDGSDVYNDSKWRSWLKQINDCEDDSLEKLDVAQRLETEIKLLTDSITAGTLSSPSSPAPLSHHLPASDVFDSNLFGGEPMDVDFRLATNSTQSSSSSSNTARSSPPAVTSSSDPPKIKLSLKEYMVRKKQRGVDEEHPIPPTTSASVAPAPGDSLDVAMSPPLPESAASLHLARMYLHSSSKYLILTINS